MLLLSIERELQVKLSLLDQMFNCTHGIAPKGCTDVLVNTGSEVTKQH